MMTTINDADAGERGRPAPNDAEAATVLKQAKRTAAARRLSVDVATERAARWAQAAARWKGVAVTASEEAPLEGMPLPAADRHQAKVQRLVRSASVDRARVLSLQADASPHAQRAD